MRWLIVALMAWEGAAWGTSQMTIATHSLRVSGLGAEVVKQIDTEIANELGGIREVTVVAEANAKSAKKCGVDQGCLLKYGKAAKAGEVLYGEIKPLGKNNFLVSAWMLNVATAKAVQSDSATVEREEVVREVRRQVVKLITPERVLGQMVMVGPATTRVLLNGHSAKIGEHYELMPGCII